MPKITPEQRDVIVMAHDLNAVLTAMANKAADGDITTEDLAVLPNLATYSSRVMSALLDEMTDAREDEKPTESDEPDDVREGEVV